MVVRGKESVLAALLRGSPKKLLSREVKKQTASQGGSLKEYSMGVYIGAGEKKAKGELWRPQTKDSRPSKPKQRRGGGQSSLGGGENRRLSREGKNPHRYSRDRGETGLRASREVVLEGESYRKSGGGNM